MDIFKKTAFCVLVSSSLIACGGGGGDETPSNTPTKNDNVSLANLTTSDEVAKATAAVLSSLAVNEILYISDAGLFDERPQGDSVCSNGGKTTITYDGTKPLGQNDGTIVFADCKTSSTRIDTGKLIYQCQEDCDNSMAISTDLARHQLLSGGIKSVLNGTWQFTDTGINNSTYKGYAIITKDGLSSKLDFSDGIKTASSADGVNLEGTLSVSDGNAQNCVTGQFSYKTLTNLSPKVFLNDAVVTAPKAGTIELRTGDTIVAKATFNNDGSIKVRLSGQVSDTTVSKTVLEDYCALGQIRAL